MKYLGSYLSSAGTSDVDVDARISKGSQAFGALSKRITRSKEMDSLKGAIYVTLVLNVVLYGWTLTGELKQKLISFHHRCVRRMCRVTTLIMSAQQIHHSDLLERLGIQSIDYYYNSRVLRWAGHVSRMPMSRRPRLFLTSGVPGLAQSHIKTWGKGLDEILAAKGLPRDFSRWRQLAMNRGKWRKLIKSTTLPADDEDEDAAPQQ